MIIGIVFYIYKHLYITTSIQNHEIMATENNLFIGIIISLSSSSVGIYIGIILGNVWIFII